MSDFLDMPSAAEQLEDRLNTVWAGLAKAYRSVGSSVYVRVAGPGGRKGHYLLDREELGRLSKSSNTIFVVLPQELESRTYTVSGKFKQIDGTAMTFRLAQYLKPVAGQLAYLDYLGKMTPELMDYAEDTPQTIWMRSPHPLDLKDKKHWSTVAARQLTLEFGEDYNFVPSLVTELCIRKGPLWLTPFDYRKFVGKEA